MAKLSSEKYTVDAIDCFTQFNQHFISKLFRQFPYIKKCAKLLVECWWNGFFICQYCYLVATDEVDDQDEIA